MSKNKLRLSTSVLDFEAHRLKPSNILVAGLSADSQEVQYDRFGRSLRDYFLGFRCRRALHDDMIFIC